MLPKRDVREAEGEGDSECHSKRRHFLSTIFEGANNSRNLQEFVPRLESLVREWVREAVDHAIDQFLRSSSNETDFLGSRTLQLQFHRNLPHTLFTGSRVVSEDGSPIEIVLCDSNSKEIVASGPLSSTKVNIVVLDGDFGPNDREDWSKEDFDSKIIRSREGKRPLVTGELVVSLQDGVGQIGEVSFTDNSRWIRSGKFRLGAEVHRRTDEISIREALSNPFRVKDHRGESYQKHYPPSLGDEVWRLQKIARDGAFHKRLIQSGISCVRDFLRLYETNPLFLRSVLSNVSNKTWETIVRHAASCTLDDKKYVYNPAPGTGLLFNSAYKVVGATFDGNSYHSVDTLNMYQMRMVEDLKQLAYKNTEAWVSVRASPFVGNPILMANPADNFSLPNIRPQDTNLLVEQDQLDIEMRNHQPAISPPPDREAERGNNSSFELGEGSQMQGFSPTFRNGFGTSGTLYGHTWAPGGNYLESKLPAEDVLVDDNFEVASSAWYGNGLFLGSNNHETGAVSSNSANTEIKAVQTSGSGQVAGSG